MTLELKQMLIDFGWGLLRYGIICPLGGLALMKGVFSLIESINGTIIYKKLPTRRKVKCWLHSSALVFVIWVLFRCF